MTKVEQRELVRTWVESADRYGYTLPSTIDFITDHIMKIFEYNEESKETREKSQSTKRC
jgi:hypothetical protein